MASRSPFANAFYNYERPAFWRNANRKSRIAHREAQGAMEDG